MKTKFERAIDTIEYIYEEGDIDLIFFGHIVSMISFDEDSNLLPKTPLRRLADGFKLVSFLVSSNDFYVAQTVGYPDGSYEDFRFASLDEFQEMASQLFREGGLDDIDFKVGSWVRKTKIGTPAPPIPPEIVDLFE
jgi:hypothetical protein